MRNDKFNYTEIEYNYYDSYSRSTQIVHLSGTCAGVDYEKTYCPNVSNDSFLVSMRNFLNPKVKSGLMFPAVLFDYQGFLVFERPPTKKLISYIDVPIEYMNNRSLDYRESVYELTVPWQLYVAEYDPGTMRLYKVHMYFMKESFKNADQIMYSPPLPNFYADGSLCRPFLSDMEDIEKYEKNLSGIMLSAYDWVWNSGFNHDLQETVLTIYCHKNNSFYDADYPRNAILSTWHRHLHPADVKHVLEIWEKTFNIDNILTANWANLSVCTTWDNEVEWFYEMDSEYPYLMSDTSVEEYDNSEEYLENYPVRTYDLQKTFSIMMHSCYSNNPNFGSISGSFIKLPKNRFNVYHKLSL